MVELLLVVGLAVAVFVGFNIGGSSTGVAFGPAVGSNSISKFWAAALMSGFALLGGWTAGREVIKTMGGRIVPAYKFTLAASVVILLFIGLALLISNLFGVPASTSMTAVGATAGMGVASGTLRWEVMGGIVSWWILAPVMAFWVCAVIGRYFYPALATRFGVDTSTGSIFERRRVAGIPLVWVAEDTSRREAISGVLVVVIGCYMAYSAGASNVANAVAPLYSIQALGEGFAFYVLIGGGAIGLGAFTIARRTLDTVGNDLTDLPLLAALIVEVVSASLITFLSLNGIPASLAVSATMSIVGLGWGRATRTTTITQAAEQAVKGDGAAQADGGPERVTGPAQKNKPKKTVGGALQADKPGESVAPIGEEKPDELAASDLFDPGTTGRVIGLWIVTPSLSAAASYLLFSVFPIYG
ncbi:inorganic phosphate transporter [Haloarchaeobius sp. HME9146]|uniref:inorganic phosphate transporter n=1 Tax=Haloarchaeobius sp. HME9146 TaxID=2978732 RepID=UPI0021BFB558|nr:inorganic phosphate transporter [Haloarchaeobius sp. HME9146]MCT9094705.1 anion permease [Haloarchaeobius sp. HME9146]